MELLVIMMRYIMIVLFVIAIAPQDSNNDSQPTEKRMKFTPVARIAMNNMIEEFGGDLVSLNMEMDCQGICCKCGDTQSGVEPDAEGYTCESCGEPAVVGFEDALMQLEFNS